MSLSGSFFHSFFFRLYCVCLSPSFTICCIFLPFLFCLNSIFYLLCYSSFVPSLSLFIISLLNLVCFVSFLFHVPCILSHVFLFHSSLLLFSVFFFCLKIFLHILSFFTSLHSLFFFLSFNSSFPFLSFFLSVLLSYFLFKLSSSLPCICLSLFYLTYLPINFFPTLTRSVRRYRETQGRSKDCGLNRRRKRVSSMLQKTINKGVGEGSSNDEGPGVDGNAPENEGGA